MLFYGIYVRKVVDKATSECSYCIANVGIKCYFPGNILEIDM